MKKRDTSTLDLFDTIEIEAVPARERVLVDPKFCAHKAELRTETDWGKPWGMRMTWTCRDCGRVRGRFNATI